MRGIRTIFTSNDTISYHYWLIIIIAIATEDISATAGSDYTAIGPITVEFNPTETEKPVMLEILDDDGVEAEEYLQIQLSDPGQDGILGPKNQVLFTISDNDGKGLI